MAVLYLAYGKKMGKVENTRVLKCVQASRLYFLEGVEKWVSSTQLSSFGCLWPGPRFFMRVKLNWCPRLSLSSMILFIDTPDPRKVTADTSGLDEIGALVMCFFLDRMVTRGSVSQRGYVISIGKNYNLPKLGWDSQFLEK
jgi:hypothetical protein